MQLCTKTEFDSVYGIMQDSFPKDEIRPMERQRALMDNEYYKIYVKYAGEEIIGFITVWEFEDFAYIEHFAVAKSIRGKGTGSDMMRELLAQLQKPVCLEIEPPETDLAKRRRAFYERIGFVYDEKEWVQPPLAPGQNPVMLRLMTYPGIIDDETYKKYRSVILHYVFGKY